MKGAVFGQQSNDVSTSWSTSYQNALCPPFKNKGMVVLDWQLPGCCWKTEKEGQWSRGQILLCFTSGQWEEGLWSVDNTLAITERVLLHPLYNPSSICWLHAPSSGLTFFFYTVVRVVVLRMTAFFQMTQPLSHLLVQIYYSLFNLGCGGKSLGGKKGCCHGKCIISNNLNSAVSLMRELGVVEKVGRGNNKYNWYLSGRNIQNTCRKKLFLKELLIWNILVWVHLSG